MPDLEKWKQKDIDLSDLPEVRDWAGSVVGKFYRPIKKPLTLRVDADVLAWLKSEGKGYQNRINPRRDDNPESLEPWR